MYRDIWSRIGGGWASGGTAPPIRPLGLEPLEPRLLLSADVTPAEPLSLLEVSVGEQVVLAELNDEDQGLQPPDVCIIAAYEVDGSAPDDTVTAEPISHEAGDVAPPVQTAAETSPVSVVVSAGAVESALAVVVDSEVSSVVFADEPAGPVGADPQVPVACSQVLPGDIRGPPEGFSTAVSSLLCGSCSTMGGSDGCDAGFTAGLRNQ